MKQKLLNLFAIIFLLIAIFLGYDGIDFDENKDLSPQQNSTKNVKKEGFKFNFSGIAKVTDGDSIKVENYRVRLLGIDAPELKQNCFDAQNQSYKCGEKSREFLINLADEKSVNCVYNGKDIYDRYLAYCFIGEVSINNEILKNGHGVIYNFRQASREEIELEKSAKNKKLGIWQGAFQLPKDYRKKHKK